MEDGWIKLWRKSIDSQVFQDSDLWKVWSWCLMKASHKEIWLPVQTGKGFTQVKLCPGQFIFGRFEGAKELKMKPSSVRNRIQKLKNIGNVDIQPDKHYSLISIINWESYQHKENESGQAISQPEDTQRTGTGQPEDTNKNVKNDKNVKKEDKDIYGEFQNVKLTASEYKKLIDSFGNAGTLSRIENLSQYVASKGKKYSSHYATILSWERKNDGTNIGITIRSDGKPQKEKCKKYDGIGTTVEN